VVAERVRARDGGERTLPLRPARARLPVARAEPLDGIALALGERGEAPARLRAVAGAPGRPGEPPQRLARHALARGPVAHGRREERARPIGAPAPGVELARELARPGRDRALPLRAERLERRHRLLDRVLARLRARAPQARLGIAAERGEGGFGLRVAAQPEET